MTTTWTPVPAVRRPARAATWIAVLLAITGVVVAIVYAGIGAFDAWQAPDRFARSVAGAAVTTPLEAGHETVVYVEGSAPVIAARDLQVTGPAGDVVTVRAYERELKYDRDGGLATAVAAFTPPVDGTYTVETTADLAGAQLAVGPDIGDALGGRLGEAGLIALLGLFVAAAIGVGASLAMGRRAP
jgi:hypothetical protein